MGSNADFMENCFKPEEYAYPSDSSKIKNWHETVITPTTSREKKTPRVFFHPASIGDGPRPPGPLKTAKNQNCDKILIRPSTVSFVQIVTRACTLRHQPVRAGERPLFA